MELVDWYIEQERKHWIRHRLEHPIVVSQDMKVTITFNQEILYLHQVLLNHTVEAYSSLTSWKEGQISFCLPPDVESLIVNEVSVQWS